MLALSLLFALPVAVFGVPSHPRNQAPTVSIDLASVVGVANGTLSKFLGIPFACAPRFGLPVAVPEYFGTIDASNYGPSCPQQADQSPLARRSLEELDIPWLFSKRDGNTQSEDCLSINVITPSTAVAASNLPVVVWIYGGGFETGSTLTYDGLSTDIVNRSIELGTPVVHVSMNYRLTAFGFLASQEVKNEGLGNFGLWDQRVALKWVQRYISAFGGDPNQVTIWGQSAGAISVGMHMVAFGGLTDGLFHAGFMQSGSPIAVGDITHGQPYYDALVNETGCTNSADTLECLRGVPFDTLMAAINLSPNFYSYQSLSEAWTPRVDGIFIEDEPYKLIAAGKVANIPVVSGDCDDEGTIFSLSQTNDTTEAEFEEYISTNYVPDASAAEVEPLWTYYPANASQGSPFDTGDADELWPQYKRLAAFQGDLAFQAPRRYFLQHISGRQNVWSYLSKMWKTTSPYGSFHTSDILLELLNDYVISFTNNLNPNLPSGPAWPQYNSTLPVLYTFADGVEPFVSNDTYRDEQIQYLTTLASKYPL